MTYNEGLASLAFRAKWTRALLWLFIVFSALGIPIGLSAEYIAQSGISPSTIVIAALVYGLISLLNLIGLAAMVPAWTYRAVGNLHILGLAGLRRSPGWAAASYFIPIAGLFVPFLAMRELYNRSIGEDEHQANASAPDVTSWWACYIAGTLMQLFVITVALFNMNGAVFIVTPPVMSYALAIFANVLMMGAAWFLIRTIRDITAAQGSSAGISETFA